MSVNSTAVNTVITSRIWNNISTDEAENSSVVGYCEDPVFTFGLHVCFMGIVCILGVLGNIVSFVVFGKDGSNPAASLQLRALVVADSTFLVTFLVQSASHPRILGLYEHLEMDLPVLGLQDQ